MKEIVDEVLNSKLIEEAKKNEMIKKHFKFTADQLDVDDPNVF